MLRTIKKWAPPPSWQLFVVILAGIIMGLILFILRISNAISYLSDDPETCINCHVMDPQYATWKHSSHREVANCNDCHVPHNNIFSKYLFKAKDGLRHATVFTMRAEPQVIFIKNAGRKVVQDNCIRCHKELVIENHGIARFETSRHFRTERDCMDCHRENPHGRVNSLASAPNAHIPRLKSPVPDWLRKLMSN